MDNTQLNTSCFVIGIVAVIVWLGWRVLLRLMVDSSARKLSAPLNKYKGR